MGWVTAAVAVGGALLSNRSARNSARDARSQANAEMDFAREQYDDWKDVYGPIQDNLGEYYANLSPDQFEVTGIQALEEEKVRSLDQLTERLAQRGISDSGIAAAAELNMEMDFAQDKASVRANSERAVAEQQLGFLQVGLGQNPTNTLQDVLSNRANDSRNYAREQDRVAGQATLNAVTALGEYASSFNSSSSGSNNTGLSE